MKTAKISRMFCAIAVLAIVMGAYPAKAIAAPAITVDLTADPTYQWISHQSTLTATTNYDVGPTAFVPQQI